MFSIAASPEKVNFLASFRQKGVNPAILSILQPVALYGIIQKIIHIAGFHRQLEGILWENYPISEQP